MKEEWEWIYEERKRIGKQIKDLCGKHKPKITQEKLGEALNVDRKTVAQIYKGEKSLRDYEIGILSRLLGVPYEFFIPKPPSEERFPHGICKGGQKPAHTNTRGSPPMTKREIELTKLKEKYRSLEAKIDKIKNWKDIIYITKLVEGLDESIRRVPKMEQEQSQI